MDLWWFNARMVVSTLLELLAGESDVQGKTTQEAILGFQNSKIGLKKLARFNKVHHDLHTLHNGAKCMIIVRWG